MAAYIDKMNENDTFNNNIKSTEKSAQTTEIIPVSYRTATEYLAALPQFMEGYGVDRCAVLLERLSHPEHNFKMIHVAGTNGKGSVCLYVHDILSKSGYRTGLFTSPHLVDIRERIRVDGKMISESDFAEFFSVVKGVDDSLGGGRLAYFDYMLGIAVLTFAKYNVEFAVIETGLGGRLDATNALQTPQISVISTISLEHTAVLGDSVEQIATEKAGIIKPDTTFVYLDGRNVVADTVIKRHAAALKCRMALVYRNELNICKNTGNYIDFSVSNRYYSNACFRINTGAMYQLDNCLEALTVAGVMREQGMVSITDEQIAAALETAHWQGRMDRLGENLYVDGAHNPEGISALVQSVTFIAKERRAVLLFSVVSDKNIEQMAAIIARSHVFDRIFITQTGGSRRLCSEYIKEAFVRNEITDCVVCDELEEAYAEASAAARELSGVLFVAGSLYLVGDIARLCGGLE